MSALKLLVPLAITDAMLTSSNVPETDYAAWAAATAYTLGQRVIRTSTHSVYERLVAGTTATEPESDTVNWLRVSPTNRWKCFDKSISIATTQAGSITYTITPGEIVTSVALIGVVATSARVKITDPLDGVVYDHTTILQAPPVVADWYAYFFEPIKAATQDITIGLPTYRTAVFEITITAATGNASCSELIFGNSLDIGLGIQTGARVGITDYSRKEKNAWGDYTIVKRAWSKKASFEMTLNNSEIDYLQTVLAGVRSTACLWIGSELYESTVIYGFYKDFAITISYRDFSTCTLEIEGLT